MQLSAHPIGPVVVSELIILAKPSQLFISFGIQPHRVPWGHEGPFMFCASVRSYSTSAFVGRASLIRDRAI